MRKRRELNIYGGHTFLDIVDSSQNSHLLKELQSQNLGTYWNESALPTNNDDSNSELINDSN
jgi:hypothetical protein